MDSSDGIGPDTESDTQLESVRLSPRSSAHTSGIEDEKPSTVGLSAGSEVIQNHDLAIHILEISRSSAEEIKGAATTTTWKGHFLALLLVNKNLFHTTIGFVWETMDSFEPMFLLLPSYRPDGAGLRTFAGIRDMDWGRPRLYGKHVKKFIFRKHHPANHIPERWLAYLVGKGLRTPFFPNLTSITVLHGSETRLLPLALNYRLHSLQISLQTPYGSSLRPPLQWATHPSGISSESSAIIANILSLSPGLKEFSYLGPISKELVRSVAEMRELTHLSLTPTHVHDFGDLLPIKKMTRLQDLKLVMLCGPCTPHKGSEFNDEDDEDGGEDEEATEPSLPNLTSLQVVSTNWNVRGIRYYIAPTRLNVVKFRLTSIDMCCFSFSPFLQLNPAITSFTATAVDLGDLDTSKWDSWQRSHQEALLASLISGIKGGNMVEVVATDIPLFNEDMADKVQRRCIQAYPQSRLATFRFHLPSKVSTSDGPKTLLYVAFEGCETLRNLELQFGDGAFNANTTKLSTIKLESTHELKTLGIVTKSRALNLSIQDKISVAMFLDALFPSIERIWGTADVEWGEINLLVQSYQTIRSALLGRGSVGSVLATRC